MEAVVSEISWGLMASRELLVLLIGGVARKAPWDKGVCLLDCTPLVVGEKTKAVASWPLIYRANKKKFMNGGNAIALIRRCLCVGLIIVSLVVVAVHFFPFGTLQSEKESKHGTTGWKDEVLLLVVESVYRYL